MPLLELPPPSLKSLMWLFVLVVLVPVVVTGVATGIASPGRMGRTQVLLVVAGVSLVTFASLAAVAFRRNVSMEDGSLKVTSSFYTVKLPKSLIKVGDIQPVDCSGNSDYAVRLRTNGLALPGYRSGWFQTRNAGKAFVVQGRGQCLRIPTTEQYQLLLEVPNAEQSAQKMKALLA